MAELFSIATYDYSKEAEVNDISSTYTEIVSVSAVRDAGVYELGVSLTWDFDRTTNSAFFRFSIDGGLTYAYMEQEPADKTNNSPFYYAFPRAHTGGEISILFEARKETGAGTLNISFADAWIKRVN